MYVGLIREAPPRHHSDMVVMNDLDRFHLVSRCGLIVLKLGSVAAYAQQAIREKRIEHKEYIARHGQDLPETGTGMASYDLRPEDHLSHRFKESP